MSDRPDYSGLCYLDVADVRGAFPDWDQVELWNDEDGEIGRLEGIVIDPGARHVQYFVVAAGSRLRRHRYLLPFLPMRVDLERRTLCVDVHKSDLQRCAEYEPRSFHRYSEGDLLAALFPSPASESQIN